MRCPQCKNKLIRTIGSDTEIRPGGKMLLMSDGRCRTKCHWCKTDVILPISLKFHTKIPVERFTVRSKG